MKKWLGLMTLLTVFVLVACGNGDEVVCQVELMGASATFTAEVENDRVISIETRINVSGFGESEIDLLLAISGGGSVEGNYLVHVETENILLDAFVASIEAMPGGSCN